MQFVGVGIEHLDPVLGAFCEGSAMPRILVRAVLAWHRLARPARHLKFRPPRPEPRIDQPVLDGLHCSPRLTASPEVETRPHTCRELGRRAASTCGYAILLKLYQRRKY